MQEFHMNVQLQESVAEWIRDRVRQEVKSQLKRAAMAHRRDDFINRLVEVLNPALSHHYRSQLATLNERTDQLAKWQEQEENFLDQFSVRILDRTKAKGLDRIEAAHQALEEIMDHDDARRRGETSKFLKAYKLKKLVPLPKDAHESFLAKVEAIMTEMFPEG
jgi:hypothetical protein